MWSVYVCYHYSGTIGYGVAKVISNGYIICRHKFLKGDFHETIVFKNYGVKQEQKSQIAMNGKLTTSP